MKLWCVLLGVMLACGFAGGQEKSKSPEAMDYTQRLRPQFHFSAPKGWINDPNGLVYADGEWHLFYQHNPRGTNWVLELSWGHAVSSDLLHWKHLPDVLPATKLPNGATAGSFSGTGFIDFNNSAGFATGDNKPIVLAWTATNLGQCLAFSNDRGRTFTPFSGNPVVPMDPPKRDDWDRDPRVFYYAPTKKWIMVFSISGKGMAFNSSSDLKTWKRESLFAGLWECPDMFELPVDGKADQSKWVIWDAAGKYFIGSFDGSTFTSESGPFILDHGRNYYAAQTWSNAPDHRRVLIGWMRGGNYPGMPFNGQMGIPSELSLRTTPIGVRLTKVPVKEVESLRSETKEWKDLDLTRNNNPLKGMSSDLLDIEAVIEPREVSEVVLRMRGTTVRVTPDLLWVNDSVAPLQLVGGKVKLRVLLDRTSLEVFANDGVASLSACFVPPEEGKVRPMEIYAEHGVARIHSMAVHRLKSVWDGAEKEDR